MKEENKIKKNNNGIFRNFGIGQEKDYLLENLTMLLDSGMDIISAIIAIKNGTKSKRMKEILNDIQSEIDAGANLTNAVRKSGIFSDHILALLEAGEASGKLPENLKIIIEQERKERMFRSRIQSALIYPAFVFFVAMIIGGMMAWFILPKLSTVFTSLKLDLPFISRVVVNLGAFLNDYKFIVIPGIIAFFIISYTILFAIPKTKYLGQKLMYNLPGIKSLVQQIELARFGYILGNLLDAGLSITQSMESLQSVSTNHYFKKLFQHLAKNVEEGNSFEKSFSTYKNSQKFIPIPVQQMIVSGEKSGLLAKTLLKVGDTFEEKSEITAKNLAVILEPIILIIVWVIVVIIALAVILPIYGLIGQVSQMI